MPPDSGAPPHSPPLLSLLTPLPLPLSNELTRWGLWRVGAVGVQRLLSHTQQLLSRARALLRPFPTRARGATLFRARSSFCLTASSSEKRTSRRRLPPPYDTIHETHTATDAPFQNSLDAKSSHRCRLKNLGFFFGLKRSNLLHSSSLLGSLMFCRIYSSFSNS